MKWIRRLIVLSILTAGCGAAWFFLKSPMMQLQSIDIVLSPESKDAFLFERIHSSLQSSLAGYLGLPFWKLSLERVMNDIKKDQRVSSAEIQREFPHHMRVIIVPKKPLLAYMDETGRVYPVARDASLMPALSLKDVPNFPLLRGKDFLSDRHLREAAVQLIETIPVDGRFQRAVVSEILHSNKDGFDLFLANQVAEVKMGDGDFDLKVSRVEKVLGYLHNRGLKGRVIDARYAKKVVVRMRR